MYVYFQAEPKILSASTFCGLLLVEGMNALVTSAIKGIVKSDSDAVVDQIEGALAGEGKRSLLLRGYFNIRALCPARGIVDVCNSRYTHIEQPVNVYLVYVIALCNVAGVIKKVGR